MKQFIPGRLSIQVPALERKPCCSQRQAIGVDLLSFLPGGLYVQPAWAAGGAITAVVQRAPAGFPRTLPSAPALTHTNAAGS
jgi:hypothetical protein